MSDKIFMGDYDWIDQKYLQKFFFFLSDTLFSSENASSVTGEKL